MDGHLFDNVGGEWSASHHPTSTPRTVVAGRPAPEDQSGKEDRDVDMEDAYSGGHVEGGSGVNEDTNNARNAAAAEHPSAEAGFSDGEIYRHIRFALQSLRMDTAHVWYTRLTAGKRDSVDRLLKNDRLVKAFDMLLPFPGLWCGLELGNIRNHLAMHCDDELECYLKHIHSTWIQVTLNDAAIQQAVDACTVRCLQTRAPSASSKDHYYIIRAMDSATLFPNIGHRDARERIKQALLGLEVIIPSIKTFHDNLKYLEIGASILKTHLLGNRRLRTTLYSTMRSQWSCPDNVLVEVREGDYRHMTLRRGQCPVDVAYKQVFISALRQFSSLSNRTPRWEPRHKAIEGKTHPVHYFLFLERARLLGFGTEKVLQGLMNDSPALEALDSEPGPEQGDDSGCKDWRSGRPYRGAYKQSRTQLFLPNLAEAARVEQRLTPSVLFVQRDFVSAFFGGQDLQQWQVQE